MIQMQTNLIVADNSGAKMARCIKVLGGSDFMITSVGDVVVVAITSVSPGSKVKKGQTALAVIVRTKSPIVRPDGSFIQFSDNAVVLVDKEFQPIGSRVFGPISREVKLQLEFAKIASLASEVI